MSNAPPAQISDQELVRNRINYRLNDIRMQPVKQLPMTIFMMWMVGNEVSLFSIMFVGMAVTNPIQAIFNVGKVFEDFSEDAKKDKQIQSSVSQSKLIYIGCCLIGLLVALTKLSWMGLMPINAMDWISTKPPRVLERSYGTFMN